MAWRSTIQSNLRDHLCLDFHSNSKVCKEEAPVIEVRFQVCFLWHSISDILNQYLDLVLGLESADKNHGICLSSMGLVEDQR
jgi:hypothetical protein